MNVIEFSNKGDFEASNAAEDWLRAHGFSFGSMQAGSPRAVWFGDCYISKWRHLSAAEKRDMDARMEGDGRHGPVRITLSASASAGARAAFEQGAAAIQAAAQGEKA